MNCEYSLFIPALELWNCLSFLLMNCEYCEYSLSFLLMNCEYCEYSLSFLLLNCEHSLSFPVWSVSVCSSLFFSAFVSVFRFSPPYTFPLPHCLVLNPGSVSVGKINFQGSKRDFRPIMWWRQNLFLAEDQSYSGDKPSFGWGPIRQRRQTLFWLRTNHTTETELPFDEDQSYSGDRTHAGAPWDNSFVSISHF